MSKVLVDRELLERVTNMLDAHNYAKDAEALMAAIAQPAEAEGVRDYLTEFAEGEVEAKTAIEELQDALSAVTAERDRLREENERLKRAAQTNWNEFADSVGERDQLRAEVEALRAFSNEIISGAFEGGSFDGGDIQDMGVKHGLLRIEQREDECGEFCACREYGFPSECYRKTELLVAAMAAKEE